MDTNTRRIVGQWTLVNSNLVWVWMAEENSSAIQLDQFRSRSVRSDSTAA